MTRFETSAAGFYVEEHTSASGTVTIDANNAQYHEIEATGDVTIDLINMDDPDFKGVGLTLYFVDSDGSGPHTISWPNEVKWNRSIVDDVIESNSDIEISLNSYDGGTNVLAGLSGAKFA